MDSPVLVSAAFGKLREALGDIHALTALIEGQLYRRALRSMNGLHDIDVARSILLARGQTDNAQLIEIETDGVLEPNVRRDATSDRDHRERQAMAINELPAFGTEEFFNDQFARADCIVVNPHRDDAAAFGQGDASVEQFRPACNPNCALCRLRINLCTKRELDGAAGGDDLIGGDACLKRGDGHVTS